MGTEANKEIVRQYVELWNTGNLALADEIIAPDFHDILFHWGLASRQVLVYLKNIPFFYLSVLL
jgi:hypothetical protein